MAFWLPLISGLGSLFGGMSGANNQAKQQQANTALNQYQTELQAWQAQQGARNTQADQMATRPSQRLRTGLQGNLVTGWQTPTVSWGGAGTIPKVTGGWQDLAFNDMSKQNAEAMQRDALARQMAGGQASDISQIAPMPSAPQMPKKSWLDTLLSIGSIAGGVAGAYQPGNTPVVLEDPWGQTGIRRTDR